jgi:hypothetical protein
MFHVSLKKGSSLTLPIVQGWKVTSSNASIISVSPGGTNVICTAVGLGECVITLQPAGDVGVGLTVGVTT